MSTYFHMVYHTYVIHLKSCWLPQESLEHNPFSTFCLIWPNSITKKSLNFGYLWKHLDPKPIYNDQVGSGPCAHTKLSEATWDKICTVQKLSKKTTHFQWLKSWKFSVNFQISAELFFTLEIWMLMTIFVSKEPIWAEGFRSAQWKPFFIFHFQIVGKP